MRKTKIICTIGPATGSYEMLERLYAAGMNVVRLNMSHGDHESHARVIKAIRTLNRKVRYTVPVMLDTQGPEIRTGHLSAELDLREGQEITIVVRGALADVEAAVAAGEAAARAVGEVLKGHVIPAPDPALEFLFERG